MKSLLGNTDLSKNCRSSTGHERLSCENGGEGKSTIVTSGIALGNGHSKFDKVLGSGNNDTWVQCSHLDITSVKQAKSVWEHFTPSVSERNVGLQTGHGQGAWPALDFEAQQDEKLGFGIWYSGSMAWRRLKNVNNERHRTLARCTHLTYTSGKWQCNH